MLQDIRDSKIMSVYDLQIKNQKSKIIEDFFQLRATKNHKGFVKKIPEKILVSMGLISLVALGDVRFNLKATGVDGVLTS